MNLISSWFFSIGLITLVSLVLIAMFQGFYLKRLLGDYEANKEACDKLHLRLAEAELGIASRYTEDEPISANGVKQILRFLKLDIAIDMADFKAKDDYFLAMLHKLQPTQPLPNDETSLPFGGPIPEPEESINNLIMLVVRLARALDKSSPGNEISEKAMDYLHRNSLGGSVLREQGREAYRAGVAKKYI